MISFKNSPRFHTAENVLDVRNLSFKYESIEILHDISFQVPQKTVFAILGPNGSGKTTLLRCLNRLLTPSSGSVRLENCDLWNMRPGERAKYVAYAPQRTAVSGLSVFDSVLLGRLPHRRWNSATLDAKKTWEVLERLNLTEKASRTLDTLSGGELQKVQMARVLVQEPKLILLDEPTSALDWKNRAEILTLLEEIVQKDGVSVILTIHDINDALAHAHRLLLLHRGEIVTQTTPSTVSNAELSEVYGLPVQLHDLRGRRVALSI